MTFIDLKTNYQLTDSNFLPIIHVLATKHRKQSLAVFFHISGMSDTALGVLSGIHSGNDPQEVSFCFNVFSVTCFEGVQLDNMLFVYT